MNKVFIHEVGLRDGLQMETDIVPVEKKLDWTQQLVQSGVDVVQVGSFVHPKYVPQMADTDELFRRLSPDKGDHRCTFSGLVLNEKGVERGISCGVELFCMGVSASETHSRKNTRMSVEEALSRTISMAEMVVAEGRRAQVSVQSAFGCGYEGLVPEKTVLDIVEQYLNAGLTNISLADTAGHAHPASVRRLFPQALALGKGIQLTCHFHNNFGMALANCCAALDVGVTWFESSFGGLGGCPFTAFPGGNVCTEDLVCMFQKMGVIRDINLSKLVGAAADAAQFLNRDLPGAVYRAAPPQKGNPGF